MRVDACCNNAIELIDLMLDSLQSDPKKSNRKTYRGYSDEEVARLKMAPTFIVDAIDGGVKIVSVYTAVQHLLLGRVRAGRLIIPTHVIEKEWPAEVEALRGKPCTPGTVSRRFRELREDGVITAVESDITESSETYWKIERVYGWPVASFGEQRELF